MKILKTRYLFETMYTLLYEDPLFKIALTALLVLLSIGICIYFRDPKCSNFNTWSEAQATFLSDEVKYSMLDGDSDGIACEMLRKKDNIKDTP